MSDSEIIARRGAEFIAALNRQDIPVLSDMRAADCVDIPPNRPAIRGLSAIQAFWREGFAQVETRFALFSEQLEVAGDIAVERYRWTAESAPLSGGPSTRDEGIGLWTWRREKDDAWKIAQAIWNSDLPQGQTVWTGAASSTTALTQQDRETLRDLIELRWVAAGLARDSGAMAAMCTEDVEYFPPDQPSFVGRVALQALFETFPPMVRFTQSFGDVEGDANRAVARCRFACTFDAAGNTVENTGKFICSFEKQASGEWLVKYCSFNFDRPMPAPPVN
jgi:ketosteroid isomerase-like protein